MRVPPHDIAEPGGNVTLEAMASGLVVIAYDYAAAGMHITNGETGVLYPMETQKPSSTPLPTSRERRSRCIRCVGWRVHIRARLIGRM
jgi:Glycosyl transferases group 1